jgi:hypothetical protein
MNSKPTLQGLLDVKEPYFCFNREERNYSALLYHLLLKGDNLRRFISCLDDAKLNAVNIDDAQVQLYFEYAFLRDLWSFEGTRRASREANIRYRKTILALLPASNEQKKELEERNIEDFNTFFDASPRASKSHIQMPGRWSDSNFDDWSKWGGREFAEEACKLKWAFNAKPDLVIQISPTDVICIEAKVESPEGVYQVKSADPFKMTQTEIQKFILEGLLGFKTKFVYLTKNEPRNSKGEPAIRDGILRTWKTVFDALDLSHELPFVAKFLKSPIIQGRDSSVIGSLESA